MAADARRFWPPLILPVSWSRTRSSPSDASTASTLLNRASRGTRSRSRAAYLRARTASSFRPSRRPGGGGRLLPRRTAGGFYRVGPARVFCRERLLPRRTGAPRENARPTPRDDDERVRTRAAPQQRLLDRERFEEAVVLGHHGHEARPRGFLERHAVGEDVARLLAREAPRERVQERRLARAGPTTKRERSKGGGGGGRDAAARGPMSAVIVAGANVAVISEMSALRSPPLKTLQVRSAARSSVGSTREPSLGVPSVAP